MKRNLLLLSFLGLLSQCSGAPAERVDQNLLGTAPGASNELNKEARQEFRVPQRCELYGDVRTALMKPFEQFVFVELFTAQVGSMSPHQAAWPFKYGESAEKAEHIYEESGKIFRRATDYYRDKDVAGLLEEFESSNKLLKISRNSNIVEIIPLTSPVTQLDLELYNLSINISYLIYTIDRDYGSFIGRTRPLVQDADDLARIYRFGEPDSATTKDKSGAVGIHPLTIWAIVTYRLGAGDRDAAQRAFLFALLDHASSWPDASFAPYRREDLLALLKTNPSQSVNDLIYARPYARESGNCSNLMTYYVHWLDLSSRAAIFKHDSTWKRSVLADVRKLKRTAPKPLIGPWSSQILVNIEHRLNR